MLTVNLAYFFMAFQRHYQCLRLHTARMDDGYLRMSKMEGFEPQGPVTREFLAIKFMLITCKLRDFKSICLFLKCRFLRS